MCLTGWILQEGPEEEDAGGVQEGQLGLRSQERRQGEHFLAAPVTSDQRVCMELRAKPPSVRLKKKKKKESESRTDRCLV